MFGSQWLRASMRPFQLAKFICGPKNCSLSKIQLTILQVSKERNIRTILNQIFFEKQLNGNQSISLFTRKEFFEPFQQHLL